MADAANKQANVQLVKHGMRTRKHPNNEISLIAGKIVEAGNFLLPVVCGFLPVNCVLGGRILHGFYMDLLCFRTVRKYCGGAITLVWFFHTYFYA
jgi:hypothetical protein